MTSAIETRLAELSAAGGDIRCGNRGRLAGMRAARRYKTASANQKTVLHVVVLQVQRQCLEFRSGLKAYQLASRDMAGKIPGIKKCPG